MRTKTVEHEGVQITVTEANVLIGVKRGRLKGEGLRAEEEDLDREIIRLYVYPDLIAATVKAEGIEWPLDFEGFLALPDGLAAKWESAVYDLNPHWLPQPLEDSKKKRVDALYQRLARWHEEGKWGGGDDLPDVHPHDLELAWRTWTLMEATGWRFLPSPGGLLQQSETIMDDIIAIAAVSRRIQEQQDGK